MGTAVCPFCGKKVDKFIMFRGDVVGCRFCGIHTKQTNADFIRSMSNEELAIWITIVQGDSWMMGYSGLLSVTYPNDEKAWLDWLKEEVEE